MRIHRLFTFCLLLVTFALAAPAAHAVRVGGYVTGTGNAFANTDVSQTSVAAPEIDDFSWFKYGVGISFDDYGKTMDKVIMGVRVGYERMEASADVKDGSDVDLSFNGLVVQGSGKVAFGDDKTMNYGIGPELTLGYYKSSDADLGDPYMYHLGLGVVGSLFYNIDKQTSCNFDLGWRWAYYKGDGDEIKSVIMRSSEIFVSFSIGWASDMF